MLFNTLHLGLKTNINTKYCIFFNIKIIYGVVLSIINAI